MSYRCIPTWRSTTRRRWPGYQRRSARAAQRVAAQISRTLLMIQQFPEMYPQLDDRHRYAVVKRDPFTVIYRLLDDRIRIGALAHSRRSMKFWQGRN